LEPAIFVALAGWELVAFCLLLCLKAPECQSFAAFGANGNATWPLASGALGKAVGTMGYETT
jgi:hypothetical protein